MRIDGVVGLNVVMTSSYSLAASAYLRSRRYTRAKLWLNTVFGTHTPWGGQDQVPVVAPPETELERALSEEIMQSGERPAIRHIRPGEALFLQEEEGASIAVILDGNFEVRVNGTVVGHAGPGTVVGERASLEGGRRTADLRGGHAG